MPGKITITYKAEGFPESEDTNHEMVATFTDEDSEGFNLQVNHFPTDRKTWPNDPTGLLSILIHMLNDRELVDTIHSLTDGQSKMVKLDRTQPGFDQVAKVILGHLQAPHN